MQNVAATNNSVVQQRRFVSHDLRGRLVRRGYYDAQLLLHGRECHWDDFGCMVRTIEWRHGTRHGDTVTYNSTGQKIYVAQWTEGRLQSITRFDTATAQPIFSHQCHPQDGGSTEPRLPVFLRLAAV